MRFERADVIRDVFAGLFDKFENVNWETLDCTLNATKAYCEYCRIARYKDGTIEEFLSVDILSSKGGLIVHKDTYYVKRV